MSAYGFLAYYLYATYIEFHKRFKFSTRILIASIIGCAIFLSYMIPLTANLSVLSSLRGIAMFTVITAYPIMDAILMVPAIVILLNFRNEPLWFTPWICDSSYIFLLVQYQSKSKNTSYFQLLFVCFIKYKSRNLSSFIANSFGSVSLNPFPYCK
jgi:hypothetical protein